MPVNKTIQLEIGRENDPDTSPHGIDALEIVCRFKTLERIERLTGMNCDVVLTRLQKGQTTFTELAQVIYAITGGESKYSFDEIGELLATATEAELRYYISVCFGVIGMARNVIPNDKTEAYREHLGKELTEARKSIPKTGNVESPNGGSESPQPDAETGSEAPDPNPADESAPAPASVSRVE